MTNNIDINKIVSNLKLSTSEGDILKVLLNRKDYSISELAHKSGIPRTNIYRICDELIDRKLANWVVSSRGKRIKVTSPENFEQIIDEKRQNFRSTVESIKSLKDLIETSSVLPQTQVRYYKGKKGMQQLIWNTLKARKTIYGYSVYGRSEIVGEKFINSYNKEFRLRDLKDLVVTDTSCIKKIKQLNISNHHQEGDHIRIIEDEEFVISGDTYIYNNIYAVNLWNKSEIIGVEIESPEIVSVQKSIFNVLWRVGKPLEQD